LKADRQKAFDLRFRAGNKRRATHLPWQLIAIFRFLPEMAVDLSTCFHPIRFPGIDLTDCGCCKRISNVQVGSGGHQAGAELLFHLRIRLIQRIIPLANP
jgi:hypothetical protein